MPATHDQCFRHLPLIPEPVLRRHRVFEPSDTRFRACARLLQALWREQHRLSIGSMPARTGSAASSAPASCPPPRAGRRSHSLKGAPHEPAPHHHRAFGLCDLGLGCPELGWVSLAELATIRGRFGLPLERDLHFVADRPLSAYAAAAQAAGRIAA